ncbi:hypothetical protein [Shimia abyssi]|uniref:Uncharacterized protein n=1 Tax=Shimia abyssi TaxID=1662395 RepID=A0A2P8FE42_9RHOB|nr:hypothetical protein [Shimia abyssi]PSL19981.1 hypothetical protein CLV88_10439 [Shimia abyssi]
MSESHAEFHDRLAKIYRKEAKGRRPRQRIAVNRDGYVIVRGAGRQRSFPWMGLAMVAVAFFGIKGAMIASYGPEFYTQKVARLDGASKVEQVAAWTMRPDPMSRWVAVQIKALK